MKRQPGATVVGAVMDADQQRFVSLHLGKIIPAMPRILFHSRCLAAYVSINQIAGDQIVIGKSLCVAQRQGRIQHRSADRSPHVDDANTMLEQFVGLGSEMISHASGRRIHGVGVMHLPRGRGKPGLAGVADIVIEDESPAGAERIA